MAKRIDRARYYHLTNHQLRHAEVALQEAKGRKGQREVAARYGLKRNELIKAVWLFRVNRIGRHYGEPKGSY